MLKVCISGGPCGGKSRAKDKLMQTFRDRGYKTLFCPETATELIVNGVIPGETVPLDTFQEFVLDKQLAKESSMTKLQKSVTAKSLSSSMTEDYAIRWHTYPKKTFRKSLKNVVSL